MYLIEFFIGLLAGIIASIITLVGDRLLKIRRQKQRLLPLAGKYGHFNLNGDRVGDWVTEICYEKKNILKTVSKCSEYEWVGRIIMSDEIPETGTGNYQYTNLNDCGVHQIQINPDNNVIFVLWTNTSHGQDNKGSYLWKKLD